MLKAHYDKTPEIRKNKKESLYDSFEQILYRYTYKKLEPTNEVTELWLSLEETVPIFLNKLITNILEVFVSERNGS